MIHFAELTPSSFLAFQKDGKEFPSEKALAEFAEQFPESTVRSSFPVRNRAVSFQAGADWVKAQPSFGLQINVQSAMGFIS